MLRDAIGDLLGSLAYLGQCFACGLQFMSRADAVWRTGVPGDARRWCDGCGRTMAAEK